MPPLPVATPPLVPPVRFWHWPVTSSRQVLSFSASTRFLFAITSYDMINAAVPKRFEYVSLSLAVVGVRRSMVSIVFDSLVFASMKALANE